MKTYLSLSVADGFAISVPNPAHAQLYVNASIGGIPSVSGATLETFDSTSPSILTFPGLACLITGHGHGFAPTYFANLTVAWFDESPATARITANSSASALLFK